MPLQPSLSVYKNWLILPDGDTINLNLITRIVVGDASSTPDDSMNLMFLTEPTAGTTADGSSSLVSFAGSDHASLVKVYANNAAALAALAVVQQALLDANIAIDKR